jgi:ribosomal protein S6
MAKKTKQSAVEVVDKGISRVYELGYQGLPTALEEGITKLVADIRSFISGKGGTFLGEGEPALMDLAYPMYVSKNGKRTQYLQGYFGWMKFEGSPVCAKELGEMLNENATVLRSMIFKTIKDEAKKLTVVREQKREPQSRSRRDDRAQEAAPEVAPVKPVDEVSNA